MTTMLTTIVASSLVLGHATAAQKQPAQASEIDKLVSKRVANFNKYLRQPDLAKAEEELSLAEGLSKDKYSCLQERSHLSLLKGDMRGAYRSLKLYFEGDPRDKNSTRGVYGAEGLRPWYWWLTLQYDGAKKATAIKNKWFDQYHMQIPIICKDADPRSFSKVDLSQAYLWMADQSVSQGHFVSADRYLKLAKKADPSVAIPKEYTEWLKNYSPSVQLEIERKNYSYPAFNTYDSSFKSIGSLLVKIDAKNSSKSSNSN